PPVAIIANITDGQIIRGGTLEVRGTATDDDPAGFSYTLRLLRARELNVVTELTSPTQVPSGALGTFDMSMLRNGPYIVELVVSQGFGQSSAQVPIILNSEVKIGQF